MGGATTPRKPAARAASGSWCTGPDSPTAFAYSRIFSRPTSYSKAGDFLPTIASAKCSLQGRGRGDSTSVPSREGGVGRQVEPLSVGVEQPGTRGRERVDHAGEQAAGELQYRAPGRIRPAGEELVSDLVLLEPVDVAAVEDRVRDAIALAL